MPVRRVRISLMVVVVIATTLVVAPQEAQAGPVPVCTSAPSTWSPVGVSEWQQLGPDQYQLVCNWSDTGNAGIAITVEYACPPYAAGRLDSVSGGDTVREGNTAYEREDGEYNTFAGTFSVHEKVFVLLDDRTFITIAAYSNTGRNRAELVSIASGVAGANRGVASLPACPPGDTTPPPVTDPPVTDPPIIDPPVTDPPITEGPPDVSILTTTSTTTTEQPTTTAPRHPLCPEALAMIDGFGPDRLRAGGIVDPSRTGMIIDGEFLQQDFVKAVRDYNAAHPGAGAYANPGVPYGQIGALAWLFTEGGTPGVPGQDAYIVGKEPQLRQAIIDTSDARGTGGQPAKLTPGEVYGLALDLTGGDSKQAMLLAHNTLRSLARGADAFLTQVNGDSTIFRDRLIQLRDNPDNAGPWYHMFGIGYFSMVDQGDYGETVSAGGAALLWVVGGPQSALLRIALGVAAGGLAGGHAVASRSRVANLLEQLYREHTRKDGANVRAPDPEKFCYNVWGSLIGESIYDALPTKPLRNVFTPFSGFPPPDPSNRSWAPAQDLANSRFFTVTNSPFAVEWDDGTSRMLFDQGATMEEVDLFGSVPAAVFPYPHPETDSWSVGWLSVPGSQTDVTFEATRDDAEMVLVRIDGQTGETAAYEFTAASRGDRYAMALDDATLAPDIVAPDGTVIRPAEIFDLSDGADLPDPYGDLAAGNGADGGGDDDTVFLVGLGLIILAALGLLVTLLVMMSKKRGQGGPGGPPAMPPGRPYGGGWQQPPGYPTG